MNFFITLVSLLFFVSPSWSYIPRAKTIVRKMVLNNGKKQYKVLRKVSLRSGNRQVEAREKWLIADGNKMKLEVSSLDINAPWKFVIVYGAKDRKTLTDRQKIKSFKKSREFLEPLFHERNHENLMRQLISHNFMPSWVTGLPPPRLSNNQTLITPEPFIFLEPLEGSVNYSIGANQTTSGGSGPRLWVEQDSFVIRKIRLGSKAELINGPFQKFNNGLKLPGRQSISWNKGVAHITLLGVEGVSIRKKDWFLRKTDQEVLPNDPLVKEFYSRFR